MTDGDWVETAVEERSEPVSTDDAARPGAVDPATIEPDSHRVRLADGLLLGSLLFVVIGGIVAILLQVSPTPEQPERSRPQESVPPVVDAVEIDEVPRDAAAAPEATALPNPVTEFHREVEEELSELAGSPPEEVVAQADLLLESAPTNAADTTLGLLHRARGNGLSLQGELVEAETSFALATELRTDDPEAWVGLGRVIYQQLRCEESIDPLRRSVELAPALSSYHGTLAFALECAGDHTKALEAMDTALSLDPTNAGAHGGRGLVLNSLGRHAEAIEDLQIAVRQAPGVASHHLELGVALEKTGATAEAIDQYRQTLQYETGNVRAQEGIDRLEA